MNLFEVTRILEQKFKDTLFTVVRTEKMIQIRFGCQAKAVIGNNAKTKAIFVGTLTGRGGLFHRYDQANAINYVYYKAILSLI